MDYSEIFAMQWKTFCNDFKLNVMRRKDAGLRPDKLDEWYELNIHRWESSIETEGTILEQQNNQELSDRLLIQLKAFRFEDVQIITDMKSALGGCIMAVAGVILSVLAYFILPVPAMVRILIAIVVVAISVVNALKGVQKSKETEYEHIRNEFSKQLIEYGNKLVSLCKSYE